MTVAAEVSWHQERESTQFVPFFHRHNGTAVTDSVKVAIVPWDERPESGDFKDAVVVEGQTMILVGPDAASVGFVLGVGAYHMYSKSTATPEVPALYIGNVYID